MVIYGIWRNFCEKLAQNKIKSPHVNTSQRWDIGSNKQPHRHGTEEKTKLQSGVQRLTKTLKGGGNTPMR